MANIVTPQKEPIIYQSGFLVLMNLLIAFHFVNFTVDQLAAMNTAIAFFSAFLLRHSVTPVADPKDHQGNNLTPTGT